MQSIRNALSHLGFYARVCFLWLAKGVTGLVRSISPSSGRRLERRWLPLACRLFRQPPVLNPDRLVHIDQYHTVQDVDDFFTLCRKVGAGTSWFEGKDVLDVGCGVGTYAFAAAKAGARQVLGIDIDDQRTRQAQRQADGMGLSNCTFKPMSAYALDLPDDTFDAAISCVVFEHLAHIDQALREIHRVLRPGGQAIVAHDSFYSRYGAHLANFITVPWPAAFFSEEVLEAYWHAQLREFMERHGLDEPPNLLRYSDGLPSLNRLSMSQLTTIVEYSPLRVLSMKPYGDEKLLLSCIPILKRVHPLCEYLRGSSVFRLEKPDAIGPPESGMHAFSRDRTQATGTTTGR